MESQSQILIALIILIGYYSLMMILCIIQQKSKKGMVPAHVVRSTGHKGIKNPGNNKPLQGGYNSGWKEFIGR
jgi:hypothetical protein